MVASIVKIAAPVQGVTYYERGPRASGQIDMLDGADVVRRPESRYPCSRRART